MKLFKINPKGVIVFVITALILSLLHETKGSVDGNFSGLVYCLPEPASAHMEGMLEFNKHLLALILAIVVLVSWLIFSILNFYLESQTSKGSNFYHSNLLEGAWTSIPAITLLKVAVPSFAVLYAMVEKSMPQVSLKIIGNQWFWAGEISDLESCNKQKPSQNKLTYTCYLLAEDEFNQKGYAGFFRLLETTKRLLLPVGVEVKLLVTSLDVLHSWSVPSLGVKVDACPGRLSQLSFVLRRTGAFYGQCSEMCGTNHGFMPIMLMVCSEDMFTNVSDLPIKD